MLFYTHDGSKTASAESISVEEIKVQIEQQLKKELEIDENSIILSIKYLSNHYKKYGEAERKAIRELAERLGIEEEWIYHLFALESGGNPQAVNKQKGDPKDPWLRVLKGRATGLIQFMPTTAKRLGTSTEILYHTSILDQLVFVEKYLSKWSHKGYGSFLDLYLAVLYPAAINKPSTFVLGSESSTARAKTIGVQNKSIDTNGNNNGLIEKSEVFIRVS